MAVNKVRAGRSPPTWLAAIKYASALVGVAAAYYFLAKLGLRLASINPSASPIWPPTGIALAAVLLGGYQIWPAIFVGAFAANATTAGYMQDDDGAFDDFGLLHLGACWTHSRL